MSTSLNNTAISALHAEFPALQQTEGSRFTPLTRWLAQSRAW